MKASRLIVLVLLTVASGAVGRAAPGSDPADQSRFVGIRTFTDYSAGLSSNANETVLLSPVYKAPLAWDQLIVSWNASAPSGAWMKVDVMGIYPDHSTKFYTMGLWSLDSKPVERTSVTNQMDADGRVNTDTLVMNRPGAGVQLQLTLAGPAPAARPQLKFIGLSFLDSRVTPAPLPARKAVWGKIIPTTERSQHAYANEDGWCSPSALSMVLTRWGKILRQPELLLDVPTVAAGVYDPAMRGTGNWSFNAAYAGSLPGIRAYVTRFSDIAEIEDWIAEDIPVVVSAPWHLLKPGRKDTGNGHLIVCIGFNRDGNVIVNDPASNPKKHQPVRQIYLRRDFIKAWSQSHNTVYLVYPETARIPADHYGQWEEP
jgi:hypothetical protein